MPFVDKAKDFLINPPSSLAGNKYINEMKETVDYLLNNGLGISNAKPTDNIITHLNGLGYAIHREEWQINVLGPLRDNGIFIGSKRGPKGGMFIPETEDDAKIIQEQILDRILVETDRLKLFREIASEGGWRV
ncbi:MAG: hypothetical protein ACOC80_12295 [Petrotogales bacterium]